MCMLTRGFIYKKVANQWTTLININLGSSISGNNAVFKLATEKEFLNPGEEPKFYLNLKESFSDKLAMNTDKCMHFYNYMDKLISKFEKKRLLKIPKDDVNWTLFE